MKLEWLKIRNFMSFGNQVQTVNLAKLGLCMLTGVNRSTASSGSNGTGKSSLIEALVYGLYGKRVDGVRGDDLINRRTGHNLMVAVGFISRHTYYVIYRFRRDRKYHNRALLYQNGQNITARSLKVTNRTLQQILGMDLVTFLHSYMIGVGSSVNFTSATDREKKAILENLTHLDLYSKAQTVAKLNLKRVKTSLTAALAKQPVQRNSVRTIATLQADAVKDQRQQQLTVRRVKARLTNLRHRIRTLPVTKTLHQLTILKRRLRSQRSKERRYQRLLQSVQRRYLSDRDAVRSYHHDLSRNRQRSENLRQTKARLTWDLDPKRLANQRAKRQDNLMTWQDKLTTLGNQLRHCSVDGDSRRLNHLKNLAQQQHLAENHYRKHFQTVQDFYSDVHGRIQALNRTLVKQRKNVADFKSILGRLTSGQAKRCFYCGQILNRSHRQFEIHRITGQLKSANRSYRSIEVNRKHLIQKLRQSRAKIQKIKGQDPARHDYTPEINHLTAAINASFRIRDRRTIVQNRLASGRKLIQSQKQHRTHLQELVGQINNQQHRLTQKYQSQKRTSSRLNKRVKRDHARYRKLHDQNPDQPDYYPKINRLSRIINHDRELKLASKNYRGRLSDLTKRSGHKFRDYQSKLITARHRLIHVNARVHHLKHRKQILENVCEVYSNRGVKSQILDLILPFINSRANHYLQILTDGSIRVMISPVRTAKNGHQTDRITIAVRNVNGGDKYQDNSSGEKRRIDIAIAMALQDYTCYHARSKCNLMCVDEAFDNLDAAGVNQIMKIMALRRHMIPNILVVSHNPVLQANFSNELKVVKTHGISKIEASR